MRQENSTRTPAPVRSGSVLLVGAFDDLSTLRRASRHFAAAAFADADFVCIPGEELQPPAGLWAELCGTMYRIVGQLPSQTQVEAIDAPEHVRECIRQVLATGGGLVLVRSSDRFSQACNIIQMAGGRIGFP